MTRTQFTDARRNLQKQIISWISIVVIGMVALVAYLSLIYGSEAIRQAVSSYYNTYSLWDIEVTSTLMMDEDDLTAIRTLPGVKHAEPVWMAGAKLLDTELETSVTVQSLPEKISVPELLTGRLPSAVGECAIEQQLQKTLGLEIGDCIRIACSAVQGAAPLKDTEYIVTGIFHHPDHISFEIPEPPYLLVTKDCFDLESLDGAFMKTRIQVDGVPDERFTEDYHSIVKPVRDAVTALSGERTAAREKKLHDKYEAQLREGQEKLDEASKKLKEASEQLSSARKQLDDGWSELKEAEEQLTTAKQKLEAGGQALSEAEYQIAAIPGYLAKALVLMEEIDSVTGSAVSDSLPSSAANTVQQYRDGARQYSDGRMLWYYSGEEYLDGLTKFESGRKQLEQGEQDYAKGKAEYEAGKAEYEDGERTLSEAREQMEKIGTCRWLVLGDNGNAGYVFAGNQANGLSSMSYSFSILFLVIAVLVIYATVGRMVQEQRALIGTSKALGLYNREVLAKYMFFGISAAVTAVVLGVGLTYSLVQKKTLANYEPFFILDSIPLCFRPVETIIVTLVLPFVSGVSVWLACRNLIRIPAIRLLQGEQPAFRRKKTGHFSNKGLYTRLIFRNMRTDLRRVLVTIVSIAGCCQLLVGGFMIKHAIERVNDRQFGQIIQYQAELYFNPDSADASRQISQILDENALPWVLIGRHDFVTRQGDSLGSATAIVAESDSLKGFYGLTDPKTGKELRLEDEGVLIPFRMSEYQGLYPGDTLSAYDASLAVCEIPISGIFMNHFGNLLFFTPDCYKNAFGTAAAQNCFLVRLSGMSLEELEDLVDDTPGFQRIKDASSDRARLDSLSSVLNSMIFMLLGLAGVMAYFIVMNLSATYIQQKTRELTIMRINGFTVHECVTYVSWDLVVTTVTGILLGLVLGHYLGLRALPAVEGPYMQFVLEPDPRTYLYAALITAGFSIFVSSAALRRVKDLKLSDVV